MRSSCLFVLIILFGAMAAPHVAWATCGTAPTSTTLDAQVRMMGSGSYGNVSGIGTPAEGDVVYDSTNHAVAYCNGSAWTDLASTTTASQWVNGSHGVIYYSSGNVGIGTAAPGTLLSVYGGSNISSGGTGGGLQFQDRTNGTAGYQWYATGGTALLYNQTTASNPFAITNSGSVGIGTTAPNSTLQVQGTYLQVTNAAGTVNGVLNPSVGNFLDIEAFNTMNTTKYPVALAAYGGNVGIGTTIPANLLSVVSTGNDTSRIDIDYANSVGHNAGINFTQSGTFQGGIFMDQNTSELSLWAGVSPRLSITSGGNVGIATISPSYTLQVNGSVAGTSAYNNTSDARLKKNVEPIAYGLGTVMRLRPISFDWIAQEQEWKKKRQLGLIAQEVEPIVPEVVTIADDKMRTRSLAYGELVPVLVKAVQDEQAEIERLKAANDALRAANDNEAAEIDALKSRVEALEAFKP